jgi:hypothetical protein
MRGSEDKKKGSKMGKISEEDIRGIYGSKGAICIKCMTPDDFYAMKQNEIITDDDIALSVLPPDKDGPFCTVLMDPTESCVI